MATLRNHRVVIASLFLPNTAVLGDSTPPSPGEQAGAPLLKGAATPASRSTLIAGKPAPLKSIVEDLKDKVRHSDA